MIAPTVKSVVCFFAHPDDETVLAGGMIKLMTQQAIPVHIISATRGEGGELGEPPVAANNAQLGAIRERELRCASQALGATVSVLDYVDPLIGPDELLSPFEADFETLTRQCADIARKRNADLILTHGAAGEYGHPAHQLVHRAVVHAARLYPNGLIYSIAANVPTVPDHLWNQDEPAHLAIDIRPWRDAKIAAMECHVSQHALFKRRQKLQTVAEALRTIESVRRVHPALEPDDSPEDAFTRLLTTAGAWRLEA
jgi:LmbE family N-acetylglucosaminyl deacetylase